jgi:hypothetical protein
MADRLVTVIAGRVEMLCTKPLWRGYCTQRVVPVP